MAAPVFTLDNLAYHIAAYRARIEQRRVAIESRPPEKRFVLAEPPRESKEFLEALFRTMSFRLPQPEGLDRTFQVFNTSSGARTLTPEEMLAARCERVFERLGRDFIEAARDGDGDLVRAFMEEGFPMQFFDQRTRETALHAAAGSRARPAVRVLVQHWPERPADLSLDRLFHLPLVPCDGARIVRERPGRRAVERQFRTHQSGS